jgi:hypothetical protein
MFNLFKSAENRKNLNSGYTIASSRPSHPYQVPSLLALLSLPTRFTPACRQGRVHFVKGFAFGALHFTTFTFQDRSVILFSAGAKKSKQLACTLSRAEKCCRCFVF